MSPSGSGSVLGGLAMGAGRKLGGMVSKQVDGANHVHAVAIQGLFDAHAQQQSHEHHLKSIKAAQKISGGQGFTVRTGEHSLTVGGGRGGEQTPADGGDHKPTGERTAPKEDHYEHGRKFADGMHDRMREIRDSAQGAGAVGEKANEVRGEIAQARPAITAKPEGHREPITPMREGGADRVTPGANVERVNGAIPIENKGGNPMKDTSRGPVGRNNTSNNYTGAAGAADRMRARKAGATGGTKIIDSKSPQEFMDTMESNPQHFQNNANKRFDEIAARRQKDGSAVFKA